MNIPVTRNLRQLAKWINDNQLVDEHRKLVVATVRGGRVSTDSKVAGTRFIRKGRGRASLCFEIWPAGSGQWDRRDALFRHESGETYRRHAEAVQWVKANLWKP